MNTSTNRKQDKNQCIDIVGSSTSLSSRNNWDSKPAPERQGDNNKENIKDEIDIIYKSFEQFDIVEDLSDHHFKNDPSQNMTTKEWSKRIQYEWKILMEHLPNTIYVRVYEGRMDLMRAVIIGANGTPYHDGLYFFDIFFPINYPMNPLFMLEFCATNQDLPVFLIQKIHYHSGGLWINPNLYSCGKVCLSLLNTWAGSGCEMWIPWSSTMLQVLVSIQGLILNANPYYNEPVGLIRLFMPDYNKKVFLDSCQMMIYLLRRPPRHFEDFVCGHFRERGPAILTAIIAYMMGAPVGCEDLQTVGHSDKKCKWKFIVSLSTVFDNLIEAFTARGTNCEEIAAKKPDIELLSASSSFFSSCFCG